MQAQSSINIACKDFTFQEKKFNQGENLRQIFEVVLSKSALPFKMLERNKMEPFFTSLHEEQNLYKDLSKLNTKQLKLAGLDFLVLGDMDNTIGSDQYKLYINFHYQPTKIKNLIFIG